MKMFVGSVASCDEIMFCLLIEQICLGPNQFEQQVNQSFHKGLMQTHAQNVQIAQGDCSANGPKTLVSFTPTAFAALGFARMCGTGAYIRNHTLTLDYRLLTCYLAAASLGCFDCGPAVMLNAAAPPQAV